MTEQHFKYQINEKIYIENRHNLNWLNHNTQFKKAAFSEQPLFILNRTRNSKNEPTYTLCFFPIYCVDHDYENNMQYLLKEIMTSKNKEGKVKVCDYFQALKKAELFMLVDVPEHQIIKDFN